MAWVVGLMILVRQVLGNWKVGKNCELKLTCEAGVMKVTMSAYGTLFGLISGEIVETEKKY